MRMAMYDMAAYFGKPLAVVDLLAVVVVSHASSCHPAFPQALGLNGVELPLVERVPNMRAAKEDRVGERVVGRDL
eukprot:1734036-Pyramimonas_sp.AAC.1